MISTFLPTSGEISVVMINANSNVTRNGGVLSKVLVAVMSPLCVDYSAVTG
jgi:hypothetical protein